MADFAVDWEDSAEETKYTIKESKLEGNATNQMNRHPSYLESFLKIQLNVSHIMIFTTSPFDLSIICFP